MSDANTIKQLRNEVQLLRDELAIMKRKYEDIIYNLDDDNFSSRFVKEKGEMRTAIKVNAEGIKTKVSNEKFESEMKQTANSINTKVSAINEEFKKYSTTEQTAEAIQSVVSKSANLDSAISIDAIEEATDKEAIYVIPTRDANGNLLSETYFYFSKMTNQWEVLSGDSIYTVFKQTDDGFALKGNVMVDGSCILTDSLTFNASDKPVQVEYSANGETNWHTGFVSGSDEFMRLKIGAQWSDAMKIVGTDGADGADGYDGSDATVTPEAVFNALTDNGANQGIFAAFVNKENQIYINAEMIATNLLKIGDINTRDEQKIIYFNDLSYISTFDTLADHTGITVMSNGFQICSKPDKIEFTDPNSGAFSSGSITLEDYVAQYAGSTDGYARFG